MATDYDKLAFFIKDYFDFIINELDYESEKPAYSQMQEKRQELMGKHGIDYFDDNDDETIYNVVEYYYNDFLEQENIESTSDFINTLITKKTEVNVDEQIKYLQVIEDFQNTQKIESLYHFGHIFKNDSVSETAESTLKTILDDLGDKNKAEVLGNISVFLEHLHNTAEGREFIESMDPKNPEEWFNELFDKMHKSSPLQPSFDYSLQEKLIKHQIQSGGLFDGLYYITDFDKESQQAQISSTSSLEANWENSSVLRHALANTIVNKALNKYFYKKAEKAFSGQDKYLPDFDERVKTKAFEMIAEQFSVESFVNYDESDVNTNRNKFMADNIQQAVSDYLEREFKDFDNMMKVLSSDPLKFIRQKLAIDHNEPISRKEMAIFIDDNDLFKNQSYFVNYSQTSVRVTKALKNTTLWGNVVDNDQINNPHTYTPEEFRSKTQYMGLYIYSLKEPYKDNNRFDKGLSAEATTDYFAQCIRFRAFNERNTINNAKLDDNKTFERALVSHFMLESPENIKNNQMALDTKTTDNILNYIQFFIYNFDENNFVQKMNDLEIDYQGDFLDFLTNLSQSRFANSDLEWSINERKEKIEEREVNLINKGLMCLNFDKENEVGEETKSRYNKFLKREGVSIEQKELIELLQKNCDGEENEATIHNIQKAKETIRINNSVYCSNAVEVLDSNKNENQKQSKVSFEHKNNKKRPD